MLEKIYNIKCDVCGDCIHTHIGNKLSYGELVKNNVIIYRNKHFCSSYCLNKFKQEILKEKE